MRLQVFCFILVALFSGCGGDPRAYYYTTQKPSSGDIVGRWTIDKEQTERCGPKVDFEIPSVVFEFADDGTFTMKNMPDKWCAQHHSQYRSLGEAGHGTWAVKKHQEWWALEICINSNGTSCHELMLAGNSPPKSLHYVISDPDLLEGLVFKKL